MNYDLPWNPQRIEQRIGRCHRYGQKSDVVVVNFLNKANAADLRIYQLLDQKFKLFHGVFGASDEVLGAIESGVDFERRIIGIYQACRTPEQIELNFNQLQQELESQIDERLQQTRRKLLENFDEEVAEKLKIKSRESSDYLTKFENWLWRLTRFYLSEFASFEDDGKSFTLTKNPFPEEVIHPGPYRSGKNVEDANLYRIGHPLAQRIIEKCKGLSPGPSELAFRYTGAGKTITILEQLVGKSGWLSLENLTISAFEVEDWLLFAGATDDGMPLHPDQCQRMFSLDASDSGACDIAPTATMSGELESQLADQQRAVLTRLSEKNADYFELEMSKLDGWAGDLKEGLEHELKEIDGEIKEKKREAQLVASLESKVALHKRIKELESKRAEKRHGLFAAQDAVDTRKDALLTEIENRLKQGVTKNHNFHHPMEHQMTPDEQVAENIIAAFKKEQLLSDEALAKLKPKLSAGVLSGADWKIFFDVDRPKKDDRASVFGPERV